MACGGPTLRSTDVTAFSIRHHNAWLNMDFIKAPVCFVDTDLNIHHPPKPKS